MSCFNININTSFLHEPVSNADGLTLPSFSLLSTPTNDASTHPSLSLLANPTNDAYTVFLKAYKLI